MGVKTAITLDEVNTLFNSYKFTNITPTASGIIDTTYIVSNKEKSYILKKYERDIGLIIERDKILLKELNSLNLNVPLCLDENNGWYLYKILDGVQPKNIQSFHIQELARFLSKLHSHTFKRSCDLKVIDKDEISSILNYTKKNFYYYYKKLCSLKNYNEKCSGLIHGDIFKDNTVFEGNKIGVFDFVDSGCGSFSFDVAVAIVGFGIKKYNSYYINLFLNTYNQHAPKKLIKKELFTSIDTAAKFYALKRVYEYKSTKQSKELIRYI